MKVFTKLGSAFLVMLFTCSLVFAQNSNSVQNSLMQYYKQTGQEIMAKQLLNNAGQSKYTAAKLDIKGATAYAFVAYDPSSINPVGPAYFDTDVPGAITSLGMNGAGDFIAGGSWADDVWYGSEYGTGAIYTINPSNGAMALVGTGSAPGGLNALAYDNTTLTMYGCNYGASSGLYTVNLSTGAQTFVGDVGGGALVIGLACDASGNLFAADLIADNLLSINKATGAGTIIGPLGIDINYAQDLEYDNENNILYLAGYTFQGELYTVNPATGTATLVGAFQGGAEMCGLAFEYTAVQYTNDVGIQTILSPSSGINLGNAIPVTIRIKNYGTAAQSNFGVQYTMNGGAPVTATITTTIASGATYDYTFPGTVDLSAYGTYVFEACTNLSGDENAVNNCKTKNVTNSAPSLCVPQYSTGCSFGDGLTSFTLTEIQNLNSGCANLNGTGWSQYFGLGPAMLSAGGTYDVIMVGGYDGTFASMWIDFNDDLLLSPDEALFIGYELVTTGVPYTVSITIPSDAPNGLHVMRARTNWLSAATDPCAMYTYGEAEDYMVQVGPGSGNYVFFHDFENYTAGQQVACEYPLEWTTWSNAPCGSEDAYISDLYAYSGINSAVIAQNNDLVKDYGDMLTTGKYSIRFQAYIPAGKAGYFNTLQKFTGSQVWGLEVYFNLGGAGSVNAGGTGTSTFTWTPGVWFPIEHIVDLDNDMSEIWIDGNMIQAYQWSLGASGTGQNTLEANDFFGATANDQMFIDDYLMEAMAPPPPPPPPANLTGPSSVSAGESIDLMWDAPGGSGSGEWIQWDAGVNNGNAIGLTAGGLFWTASHWTPAELAPYNGQYLEKISFFPYGDPAATFNLYVWTGPNAGTQVYSQAISSYTVDQFNEITLTTPVMINASQELWFGYSVSHGAGTFPAGTDDGPAVGGKGDMISLDGTAWVAMGATYGLNYNWNLAGYVAPSDGGTAPAKPMVKSFTGAPSVGSLASAKESGVGGNINVKFNPSDSKGLTGYNVYRKNPGSTTFNVIGYTTETNYSDNVTVTGLYQYYVTAVYENPTGESNPTNTITVDVITGIEDVLYNSTAIYPNPASSVVNIKSDYTVNTIKVYNYSGQVIASEQADSKFYQFNTSRFTPGLYLFQIETAEGTITKRIIIE